MKKLLAIVAFELCLAISLADSPTSAVGDMLEVPASIITDLNSKLSSILNTSKKSENGSSLDPELTILIREEDSTKNSDYEGMTDDPDDSTDNSTDDPSSTDDPFSTINPLSTDDSDGNSTGDSILNTTNIPSSFDSSDKNSTDGDIKDLTADSDKKSSNSTDAAALDDSESNSNEASNDNSGKRVTRSLKPFSLNANIQIDPDFSRLNKAFRHSNLNPASLQLAKKLAELRQSHPQTPLSKIRSRLGSRLAPSDQDLKPNDETAQSIIVSLDDGLQEQSDPLSTPGQTNGIANDLSEPIRIEEAEIDDSDKNGIANENSEIESQLNLRPSQGDSIADALESLDTTKDLNQNGMASLPDSKILDEKPTAQTLSSSTTSTTSEGSTDSVKVFEELKEELSRVNSFANELGEMIEHNKEVSLTEPAIKTDDILRINSLYDNKINDDLTEAGINDKEHAISEATGVSDLSAPNTLPDELGELNKILEESEARTVKPTLAQNNILDTEKSTQGSNLMPLDELGEEDQSADISSNEESSVKGIADTIAEKDGLESATKPSEDPDLSKLLKSLVLDVQTEAVPTSELTPTIADVTSTQTSPQESSPGSELIPSDGKTDIDEILNSLINNDDLIADPETLKKSPQTLPPSDSDPIISPASIFTDSDDNELPQELTSTTSNLPADEKLTEKESETTITPLESTSDSGILLDILKSIRDWTLTIFTSTTEKVDEESTAAPISADEDRGPASDLSKELNVASLAESIDLGIIPEVSEQPESSSVSIPTLSDEDKIDLTKILEEPDSNPGSILADLAKIADQPILPSVTDEPLDFDSKLSNILSSTVSPSDTEIKNLEIEQEVASIAKEAEEISNSLLDSSSTPSVDAIISEAIDEILKSPEPTVTTLSSSDIEKIVNDEIGIQDLQTPSTSISVGESTENPPSPTFMINETNQSPDLDTQKLTSSTIPTLIQTTPSTPIYEPQTSNVENLIQLTKILSDDIDKALPSQPEKLDSDKGLNQVLSELGQDIQSIDDNLNEFTKEYQEFCSNSKTTINFSGMKIRKIGYPFLFNDHIKCMDVSDCDIVTVDKLSFDGLPNLKYIDMSYNRFDLNIIFMNDLPNAEVIILDNSGFKGTEVCSPHCGTYQEIHLEKAHPQLRKLSISNTYHRLKISSSSKTNLPSLTHLHLSETRVEEDNFDWLPESLRYLDLSGHALRSLTLRNLKNLHSISLDYPAERDLDRLNLTKLPKLEKLSARSNNINEILISTFATTKSLSSLDLFDNKVRFIESGSFDGMKHLKNVNLAQNTLVIIEEGIFDDLTDLETLDLSKSFISMFSTINNVPKLKKLSLNCNHLRNIPGGTFANMPNLESLYLHNNRIEKIDQKGFSGLSKLKTLTLSNNLLTSLPYGWTLSLERLETLDLSGNRFSSTNSLALYPLSPVKKLYLSNLEYMEPNAVDSLPKNVTIHLETKKTFVKPCKMDGKVI
ncbi:hypothetical protein QAD02_004420 [Eretmocerus hayati]|uniref:Uncharacterized protein n=1 Tax=Eretmocerus hayati TaxID=131215 RepID=A0ACC2NQS4_9HYME|nr:hypothetical protein QAD02_004420 [Eretmocerus hayati]